MGSLMAFCPTLDPGLAPRRAASRVGSGGRRPRAVASRRTCLQPLWSPGQWACLRAAHWGLQILESCARLTTGSLGEGRLGAPGRAWPAVLRLGEGPGAWLPRPHRAQEAVHPRASARPASPSRLRFMHKSRHGRCDEQASLPPFPPLTRSRAWPRARADVHTAPRAAPPGPAGPLLTITRGSLVTWGSLGSHRNRLLPALPLWALPPRRPHPGSNIPKRCPWPGLRPGGPWAGACLWLCPASCHQAVWLAGEPAVMAELMEEAVCCRGQPRAQALCLLP